MLFAVATGKKSLSVKYPFNTPIHTSTKKSSNVNLLNLDNFKEIRFFPDSRDLYLRVFTFFTDT